MLKWYIINVSSTLFKRPVIEDLNVEGEIVTSIDPYSNVIEDPTVQALLESLDGDRTVVRI